MNRTVSLYLVPTPIGNLEDMTLRAIRILKEVNFILSEDTRTTGNLLRYYGIDTKLSAFHAFNEHRAVGGIVEQLGQGATAALVSDAGTPGISDPGFLLVRECLRAGLQVETLPGPTALIPALVNSGLPCERFFFAGFLPHKKGRQTLLTELVLIRRTLVLYESPHRLLRTLEDLAAALGAERNASVSRELTKIHEENAHGTLAELISYFGSKPVKGEIVIVIDNN